MAERTTLPRTATLLALAMALALLIAAPASAAPNNTSPPSISGGETAQEGQPLSADEGDWIGPGGSDITFTYQWRRCDGAGNACTDIPAASGKNYVPTTSDVGRRLRVRVTGNCGVPIICFATSAQSGPSSAVDPDPVNEDRPEIVGTARRGSTLEASTGFWRSPSPLNYAYQWVRCDTKGAACQPIPGATGVRYKLASADVRHSIRVVVTAFNSRPRRCAATSPATALVSRSGTRRRRTRMLSPFPTVTLAGVLSRSGARVTRFSVRAPRGAAVKILCKGRSCPFKTRRFKMRKRTVRVRALQRPLRAGTVLRVTVTRAGFIGKYSRIRIRSSAGPVRSDRCLRPGARKPTRCPR